MPMTPAMARLDKAKIAYRLHSYAHEASAESFGDETVARLGVEAARVFKTLIAQTDAGKLVMGLVPVSGRLSTRALASAVGAKRVELAEPGVAERAAGSVVGGISPLFTRKPIPLVLDASARAHATLFVSAGRRGLQLELAPEDLIRLTKATVADIAAPD